MNPVLSEMANYLWVIPLWRRHLDGHHRLLPGGQPCPGLGLGEGQGERDLDEVFFSVLPCLRSSMIKIQVDRMVEEGFGAVETLPRCWMAWAVTAIWPLIFLTGFLKKLLLVGSNGVLVSGLSVQTIHNPLFRFECTSLLHRTRNSP